MSCEQALEGLGLLVDCTLSEVQRKQRTMYTASALLSPVISSLTVLFVRSRDNGYHEEISSMP
jgi:hypothetical protein